MFSLNCYISHNLLTPSIISTVNNIDLIHNEKTSSWLLKYEYRHGYDEKDIATDFF